MNRRGFLAGILAAGAAPAIVRASSLMVLPAPQRIVTGWGWKVFDDRGVPFGEFRCLVGTTTGRISSSVPTFQEIPRNFPIQGAVAEMQNWIKNERARRAMEMNFYGDLAIVENRIELWQP